MLKLISLAAVAASLSTAALAGQPAMTDGGAERPLATIQYKDLDLATAAGQRTLKNRVAAAKRATCRTLVITGTRLSAPDSECEASFHEIVDAPIKAAIAKAQARVAAGERETGKTEGGASQ